MKKTLFLLYAVTIILCFTIFVFVIIPRPITAKQAEKYAIEFVKNEKQQETISDTVTNVESAYYLRDSDVQRGWYVDFQSSDGNKYSLFVDMWTPYILYARGEIK